MSTNPRPLPFVLYPRVSRTLLGIGTTVAVPMMFLIPLQLYANTLPPRPPGGILNVQTVELFAMMALGFAAFPSLGAVDYLILRSRQWKVSAEGLEVERRSIILRHIAWAEITSVLIMPFAVRVQAGRGCEVLYCADPLDMASLKEWYEQCRAGSPL